MKSEKAAFAGDVRICGECGELASGVCESCGAEMGEADRIVAERRVGSVQRRMKARAERQVTLFWQSVLALLLMIGMALAVAVLLGAGFEVGRWLLAKVFAGAMGV